MSKIIEKKQEIEKIKSEIYSFMDDKNNLEKDINDLKREFENFEDEYNALILNGQQDKADALFVSHESKRKEYELKNKRLESMELLNADEVVIKKWKEISVIANSLEDEYRKEHDDVLTDYLKARVELENKKKQLEEISYQHKTYNYALNVECSGHFHGIGRRDILTDIVSRDVFPEYYVQSKLKQYQAEQQ
ncbi:hypothetical protein [Macrococcoides caseolyticum]|uniref:hypothetical protein n=1 Tax=Macrococcoides caseolyticum TaxID=69966 RepID=UPI000C338F4A|nr:hypothetical protein [Macrococcus caseolyticus]PKE19434.1 hypothetical protein CW679_05825 [Macrococcus caseolyticus]PKF40945.1 hypothetical protein CW661_05565 [Macrococcus caseolyticus]